MKSFLVIWKHFSVAESWEFWIYQSGPLGDDMFALLPLEKLFLLSGTWGLFVKLGLPGAFGRLSEYLTGDVTEALWVSIVTQVSSTKPKFLFFQGYASPVGLRISV